MSAFERNLKGIVAELSITALREIPEMRDCVHFTTIDKAALQQWRSDWIGHPDRRIAWDWGQIMGRTPEVPERVSFALYHGDILCGLAYGYVSSYNGERGLDMRVGEGAADRYHPLKGRVRPLTVWMSEVLAMHMGLDYVRRWQVRPEAAPLGYKFYGAAPECNFYEKYLPKAPESRLPSWNPMKVKTAEVVPV